MTGWKDQWPEPAPPANDAELKISETEETEMRTRALGCASRMASTRSHGTREAAGGEGLSALRGARRPCAPAAF